MPTQAPAKPSGAGMSFLLLFVVLAPCGCLGPFVHAMRAPPVEKAVALIEASPEVAAALGSPVDVSLIVTTDFDRTLVRREGRDQVDLLTKAEGQRGEAWVSLSALNVDEQGWAGRFEVRQIGSQVLVDGAYRTDGGGVLLRGTFAPDGSPIVAP